MNDRSVRRIYLPALLLLVLVAFFCLAYPIYVIRPFRHQGPGELMAALAVLRYRAVVTALCAAGALAGLVWYWRAERRRWPRVLASLGALAVCGFTLLSRVNIYELMFHPLVKPAFSPVAKSKLAGGEMVIAIQAGGADRAYPIRVISYHHIVNDTLGGVAIAATY